ncbi:MAG TPA: hypothetical protein VFP84_30490 [Kofleriaceae bacterium]|nr:hypothetical protein [Kofleriaceae bacterium]
MTLAQWVTALAVISASVACTGDDAQNAPRPQTPIGFRFEAIGGRSFASFGWAGTQHNIGVPDGTPFSVKVVNCQGSDGPCLFEGPVQLPGDLQRQRCLNRLSQTCTQDSDCSVVGGGSCVFIYDPPTTEPLPSQLVGGIGACGWSYIPATGPDGKPAIIGSIDQTSGEVTLQRLLVNLSLNGAGGATHGGCEVCVGDDKANDGKKNGTCKKPNLAAPNVTETSVDDGKPCDLNRESTIPGLNAAGYSMDCSPTLDANSFPTPIGGAFSTADVEMSASDGPACTFTSALGNPNGNASCFCGVCNKDGLTGCHTSADCTPGDTCGLPLPATCMPDTDGKCTKDVTINALAVGVVGTRSNDCVGGACNWNDETGIGTCMGVGGFPINCYPGGTNATIRAKGSHVRQADGTFIVDTANAACDGATPNVQVNRQIGLPGLIFQKRGFRILPQFGGAK